MENELKKTGINWEDYQTADAWFNPELGKEYLIGFSSAKPIVKEYKKQVDGREIIEKANGVAFEIDNIGGVVQSPALVWEVTAKTVLRPMAEYDGKGMIYTHLFSVKKIQLPKKEFAEYQIFPFKLR